MRAPPDDAQPYAWAIEYPIVGGRETRVSVICNDGQHDLAYVMQRAADLHGVVLVLIRDRRKDGHGHQA